MNRMFVCVITLVLLLGCCGNLAAQEDTYIVQPGDNLWNLAGAHLDDAKLWESIYKDNPFLQEPGRRFQKDGIVYVMIRPGEKLVGLEKLGIIATLTPIDRLHLPQQTAVYEVPTTPMWVWWLHALAVLLFIFACLVYRMLNRDPVNSGPAMVPGGVTETNATTAMQQVAARAAGYNSGESRHPDIYQQFTILRQIVGRIWGDMTVRYADGQSIPRRLNGVRAYEARVIFPNGTIETLYMLQGCGNDLRYAGISRYLPGPEFRFERDPVVPTAVPKFRFEESPVVPTAVPEQPASDNKTAQPAPVSEPKLATPTPEMENKETTTNLPSGAQINKCGEFVRTKDAPSTPHSQPEGVITFEFKRSSNGQPNLVRLQGVEAEELTFSVGPDGMTVRYREVAKKTAASK